jgi:hypothetical protein
MTATVADPHQTCFLSFCWGKRLRIGKVELGDLNAVERVQVLEGGAHSIPRKASSGGGVSMDTYVLLRGGTGRDTRSLTMTHSAYLPGWLGGRLPRGIGTNPIAQVVEDEFQRLAYDGNVYPGRDYGTYHYTSEK